MRLSRTTAAEATAELRGLLRQNPHGLTTSELIGTPRFHGTRTLSAAQVRRLLRAAGAVEDFGGTGAWAPTIWRAPQMTSSEKRGPR